MCLICNFPNKSNHANWLECTTAWRERAGQAEAVIAQQKDQIAALERKLVVACEAFAEIRSDLEVHFYASADYQVDRALRILDGRA